MKNTLPVLILKNLLLLPNQEVKLELTNDLSQKVVLLSSELYHNELIVMPLKDQMEEMPDVTDLPEIAIVAKVKSQLTLPNGNLRVTLRGLFRAKVQKLANNQEKEDILECQYSKMTLPKFDDVEALAVKRKIEKLLTEYVRSDGVSNSILNIIKDIKDLNKLTDMVASFLPLTFDRKLGYIEEINPVVRGNLLIDDLHLELEVIHLDQKLEEKLQSGLEESQKEFILKEKLREIEEELGDAHSKYEEVNSYEEALETLEIENPKVVQKIKAEIKKLKLMNEVSPEIASVRNYLDWMIALPWNKYSEDETDLETIQKSLDKTHFGMGGAKEKIIEYIAAKNRCENVFSPILCLVGPSGVGKTTFAKSIANALNKEFCKISVGGLNDSAILNGHRRTYLGASPGKIIESLKKCGTKNPVILIDEVDKMVKDYKGDPASTLLDILDKTQNQYFVDNYIEEEFDLSHVLFILTANDKEDIPPALYDRLEVIELSSYTLLEKTGIAKKYILPNLYREHNVFSKDIKLSDGILKEIITNYTNEAGVRDLERTLKSIIRKLIVKNTLENVKVTHEMVLNFLGPSKYEQNFLIEKSIPGVVNALAVHKNGGIVMPIETCFYEGSGKVKITGLAEKVMDESISVAVSYIISNKDKFRINDYYFKTKDLHIHLLDAGVKKDGPSAGIAITTAIISLARNDCIPNDIAMTGEITLNGFVKRIGGLKDKLIGAYNEGIKKVFIPKENHNDLLNVPNEVIEKIEIIEVENYEEIYNTLFR